MNLTQRAEKPTPARGGAAPDIWQSTRSETVLATQIQHDANDYLAAEKHDIGRQTGTNQRELFVSCDPTLALQQQLEHLQPEFIAIHDIATASSRKLLAGIAAASQRAVQSLVIRRQGYGTALARLEFIDLPGTDGQVVRMYSTEAEADTAARQGLARMLLAFSRLGVVMVGDLPSHAIESALRGLQDQVHAGPWPGRELLLLPLAAGSTLSMHGTELARATGINVRTSPQVVRPADAWGFINGTWGRLRDGRHGLTSGLPLQNGAPHASPLPAARAPEPPVPATTPGAARAPAQPTPAQPAAPTRPIADPLSMRPMPAVPTVATRTGPATVLERYVQRLIELPGMASCCVFDVASGLEVAHAGASPSAASLAMHGKALLASMGACSRTLGLGHALPEAAITLGSHHLLLRAVPGQPGLALHAALDKSSANLTLVRLQVQRLDASLGEPLPAPR